jgi:hypothetical protein
MCHPINWVEQIQHFLHLSPILLSIISYHNAVCSRRRKVATTDRSASRRGFFQDFLHLGKAKDFSPIAAQQLLTSHQVYNVFYALYTSLLISKLFCTKGWWGGL